MIDANNTYVLIEDHIGSFYKMPLAALESLIVMKNEENEKIQQLIEEINELSIYILTLSSEIVEESYSMEELSSTFEFKTDVDAILTDKSILNDVDIEKFINDKELVTKDSVELAYEKESSDADDLFDKISEEATYYDGDNM